MSYFVLFFGASICLHDQWTKVLPSEAILQSLCYFERVMLIDTAIPFSSVEQNKVKAGSQDGVNCSETLPLGNLSIKGDPIKEDPSKEDPIKDLIKTLNPKLEVDLGALMKLTEEQYQVRSDYI